MADPAASNAMLEDDPNSNSGPRWGPNHKGAKELQALYSRGNLFLFHSSTTRRYEEDSWVKRIFFDFEIPADKY